MPDLRLPSPPYAVLGVWMAGAAAFLLAACQDRAHCVRCLRPRGRRWDFPDHALIANPVARTLCVKLSDRFEIASPSEPAGASWR